MFVFFQFFFRILSFAVFVTGFCGLLNYLFDWHLSIEGTEAPAEFEASIMLLCFSVTLAMWGELVANNHYVVRFTQKWYQLTLYILFSVLLSALPPYLFMKAEENYNLLYEALEENDVEEFQNKENLKSLSQKQLSQIFSEAIRRNSPEIARLISESLDNINGDTKSPNIFLAAYLCNSKIFAILIEKKADFSIKDYYMSNTVLHSIVTGKCGIPQKIKVILMLVQKNLVAIDGIDRFAATPLMNAVERGESEVVETLLTLKADIYKVDHVGNPVLTRACEKSFVYPDIKEEDRIKTVHVLLKHGADKNMKDYLGRDCRTLAKDNGFSKLAEEFRE